MEYRIKSYGAEHEWADWDVTCLPPKFNRADDWTIVNSNGIAAASNPKYYPYGGEINTPPTNSISKQIKQVQLLKSELEPTVNYRGNLHVHVRIPGLKDNLRLLKEFQRCIHDCKYLISELVTLPIASTPAASKRLKRNRVSHRTFLTPTRLSKQFNTKTTKKFFEAEVPMSKKGQIMWHAQPRCAINLRQLLQTDTIEFRHFPASLDNESIESAFYWAKYFCAMVLEERKLQWLEKRVKKLKFPEFLPFNEELEIKYQATANHNGLKLAEIETNRQLILNGAFHASEAEEKAKERAGCMSR